jgi:hypothetical protein
MSSLFAITAASDTVQLDRQNQAETIFTVRNLSNHPVRSRASLTVQNPIAASWLTILGSTERDLPIAGTEQYVVKLSVPENAPVGSYAFHLDMLDVENPDESFTQGPTVLFAVTSSKVERPRFRLWVLLILLGLIIVLIIAYVAINGFAR